MIKQQIKKENSPILAKIDQSNIHIFSGITNESELGNDIHWHREFHGGGIDNPLIVVANHEQNTGTCGSNTVHTWHSILDIFVLVYTISLVLKK
jgi:hypothetical protein